MNLQNLKLPPGYSIQESGSRLIISRRWRKGLHFILLFMAAGITAFPLLLIYWPHQTPPAGGRIFLFMSASPFMAAALYLFYHGIAGMLNRTHTIITRDDISVRHEPVRWVGNVTIPFEQIEKIHIESDRHFVQQVDYTYHDIVAVLHGNKTKTLIADLERKDEALFLASAIQERFSRT